MSPAACNGVSGCPLLVPKEVQNQLCWMGGSVQDVLFPKRQDIVDDVLSVQQMLLQVGLTYFKLYIHCQNVQ